MRPPPTMTDGTSADMVGLTAERLLHVAGVPGRTSAALATRATHRADIADEIESRSSATSWAEAWAHGWFFFTT